MQIVGFVLLGLLAGALSGLAGMGGGIIVAPALIYLFGYSMSWVLSSVAFSAPDWLSSCPTVRRIFAAVLGVIAANMFFQSPNQGLMRSQRCESC